MKRAIIILVLVFLVVGCQGDRGESGVMGLTGPSGFEGVKGESGVMGPTGPSGFNEFTNTICDEAAGEVLAYGKELTGSEIDREITWHCVIIDS